MHKTKIYFAFFIFLFFSLTMVNAQNAPEDELTFEEKYERNIKKSRINGVYIPVDLEDAINEIKALSTQEALLKFKAGEEEVVSRKLHFGIGRWMIVNWNFYEGSRFSHFLKELGIHHPDDQAQFVIICLHRHLNNKTLKIEELVSDLQLYRLKLLEEQQKQSFVKEDTIIRKKNN